MIDLYTINDVKQAFGSNADLFKFEEQDNHIIVTNKGYEMLPNKEWKPIHEMVVRDLKGQYSGLYHGWIIPLMIPKKEVDSKKEEKPSIDEMFNEMTHSTQKVEFKTAAGEPVILPEKKVEEKTDYYKLIALSNIITSPVKVRLSIDNDYIKELATSIENKGILQPVLVRPRPSGNYLIVGGEQRFRAAQQAGLKEIPCIVREMNDIEAFEASLEENLKRKDLSDYEVAKALNYLLTRFPEEYSSQTVLAYKLGKSDSWVSQHLKMLELEKFYPGETLLKVSERQARELLVAPEDMRQRLIDKVEQGEEIPSSRELSKQVQETKGPYYCDWCHKHKQTWQVNELMGKTYCNLCNNIVEKTEYYREPRQVVTSPADIEDKIPSVPFRERVSVSESQAEADLMEALQKLQLDNKIDDIGKTDVRLPIRVSIPDRCWPNKHVALYLDGDTVHDEGDVWDTEVDVTLKREGWTVVRERYHPPLTKTRLNEILDKIVEALT